MRATARTSDKQDKLTKGKLENQEQPIVKTLEKQDQLIGGIMNKRGYL